jgi:hypothetical protein
MNPTSRIPSPYSRLHAFAIAAIAALALLAVLGAPAARAEDTFRFRGEPGPSFTALPGSLPECWSDGSGIFSSSNEADEDGSVSADLDPFDECGEQWATEIYWGQEQRSWTREWSGGYGGFWFDAQDEVATPATLSCFVNGSEWVESLGIKPIGSMMSAEVDGTDCKVAWLPGAGPESASASSVGEPSAKYSHFVDSLARVSAGKARVEVQAFGRGRLGVEDEITLRTKSGQLIGQATAKLEVGDKPKQVSVPLDGATKRALAAHGFLIVNASIRHIDGSAGAGDHTAQLVLR